MRRAAILCAVVAAGCAGGGGDAGPLSPILPEGDGAPTSRPAFPDAADGGEPYNPLRPAPLSGTISTDRVTFSTGTAVVPAGRFQAEFGVIYTDDGDAESVSLPDPLLRYGLYPGVELRLAGPTLLAVDGGDDGLGDVTIGLKFVARGQRGAVPAVAFVPSLTLPNGGASDRDQVDFGIDSAASWAFGSFTLLVNGDINNFTAGGRTRPIFNHSEALFYKLPDVLPGDLRRVTVFAEHFGVYPDGQPDRQVIDAGVLYLLTPNLQLDLSGGVGLNGASREFSISIGTAVRL